MEEYFRLLKVWQESPAGTKARKAAYNAMLDYLVKNPKIAKSLLSKGAKGIVAEVAEAALAKIIANQAKKRPPFKKHLARLAMNLGASPKSPNPYLEAAIIVGTIAMSCAEARAESIEMEAALPDYNAYVQNYISKMALAKKYHPYNQIEEHLSFPEWFELNR